MNYRQLWPRTMIRNFFDFRVFCGFFGLVQILIFRLFWYIQNAGPFRIPAFAKNCIKGRQADSDMVLEFVESSVSRLSLLGAILTGLKSGRIREIPDELTSSFPNTFDANAGRWTSIISAIKILLKSIYE